MHVLVTGTLDRRLSVRGFAGAGLSRACLPAACEVERCYSWRYVTICIVSSAKLVRALWTFFINLMFRFLPNRGGFKVVLLGPCTSI